MKVKLFILGLLIVSILPSSVYAECCAVNSETKCNYFDLYDWEQAKDFCGKIQLFFGFNTTWNETCSPFIGSCVDGYTASDPIIPSLVNTGGGSRSRTSRTTITCEEIAYDCDDWSACLNDLQSRDCTKREVCGNIPTSRIIKETRSCTSPAVEETTTEETTVSQETAAEEPETTAEDEGGFAAITGAVVDAVGKAPWAYGITFVVIIGGLLTSVYFFRSKNKTKKK